MSYTSVSQETYAQATDFLGRAAKRNPEALLVLAAGCALLMRNRSSSGSRAGSEFPSRRPDAASARGGEGDNGIASTVSDYASSASSYLGQGATAAGSYIEQGARTVADQAGRIASHAQSSAGHMANDQPLVLAALGLAAGAVLGAFMPRTRLEDSALRSARDAVSEATSEVADTAKRALGEAGKQLQDGAADLGLTKDGLKDMARDAVGAFANTMSPPDTDTRNRGSGSGSDKSSMGGPA